MRYHIALKEEILVSADIWATSSTRLQLNVVCAHSWLLLNICSTRTTAMRIKNALVAWMRNGGKKCEACGINGTCNLPGQSMHAVTSSWSSLLLLSCSRSYGQEISFVVFKYLRCINNANGEMSLKADTEKVATLILGLFSHCLLFFFFIFVGHSENNVFLITTQEKKGRLLDSFKALKSTTWTILNWAEIEFLRRVSNFLFTFLLSFNLIFSERSISYRYIS